MKALTEDDRKLVTETIADRLDQLPLGISRKTDEPPTKRRRTTELDEFDDDEDETEPDSDEVRMYQKSSASGSDSVLDWWRRHESEYPGLSLVAKDVLCVMATSAASERNFSLAGHVVNDPRASLRSDSVNSILLVNSSLRN